MARKPKKTFLKEQSADFTEEKKLHWLRLLRSENIGPITFYHLLNRFGSAEEALKRLPDIAHRAGRSAPLYIPSIKDVSKELEAYEKIGAHLIARPETIYPELLARIPDAPPLISVMGRLDLLQKPSFAIVGARNASAVGRQIAEMYAESLAASNFVITSGLARGIDTHAHKGALKTSTGTIAVLAGGIDHIYPPENKALYKIISTEGLLLSETPLGVVPQANFFPRRNRLISGLSWGVLVVEAALKSGSLVTAHCAAEQGRDVFAIPGNPMDPRSRGTNELIRQGAVLAQSVDDITNEYQQKHRYQQMLGAEEEDDYTFSSPEQLLAEEDVSEILQILWNYLSTTPITVDELVRICKVSLAAVRAALVEMEIGGFLNRHSGDRVSLQPPDLIKAVGS